MESDRSAAVRDAWDRGAEALRRGEIPAALRYYEYAQRFSPVGGGENPRINGAESVPE